MICANLGTEQKGERKVNRPQRWSTKQKADLVLELLRGAEAVELARIHGVSQAQLHAWREAFLEAGRAALRVRRDRRDRHAQELSALERKIGQLTMANEMLKKSAPRGDRREQS